MDEGAVLVAIGASAGGVEALRNLVARLPGDFPAAVAVVLHLPATAKSQLADILERAGQLPAATAEHGAPLVPGTIVVAPPDYHLRVNGTGLELDRGARINAHRPAIDPLFRSAAAWYGPHAVGVLLSGMLDDGAGGLLRMSQAGALTIAQDPQEAMFPDLPTAAIDLGAAQEVLPVEGIAKVLVERTFASEVTLEEVVAMRVPSEPESDATVSPFTCPNCHGSLWEIDEGDDVQFRCRTGHTYSVESLVQESTSALDDAMWAAYRALLEQADLCRRMARRMSTRNARVTHGYERLAEDAERRAWVVHDALVTHEPEISESGGHAS